MGISKVAFCRMVRLTGKLAFHSPNLLQSKIVWTRKNFFGIYRTAFLKLRLDSSGEEALFTRFRCARRVTAQREPSLILTT